LFLGNIANSNIDSNELVNVSNRELVNVYFSLTNSTFSNNSLTNTAGLVDTFADVNGLTVNQNTITTTTTGPGVAPIYVGPNNGHIVSNVNITNNNITTVNGGGIG